MSATILDGRKIRDLAIPELAKSFAGLTYVPVLTIIQVGNREDTNAYIRAKKSFADKVGVKVNHIQLGVDVKQSEIIDVVQKQNADQSVKGIIVQLPLPIEIDRDAVIDTIDPKKDVDAITAQNVKRWLDGNANAVLPATAKGVMTLLKYYKIELFGKKVAVVGRSTLVGKPIVAMCLNENATVTVCHSKTLDLAEVTGNADIVIVAVGKQNLIRAEHVREGQVVVDVGINTIEGDKLDDEIVERKIVGDVDFNEVKNVVASISPVPGGVGPLTVLSIFQNLLDLCLPSEALA
jgi:methylenetetrahydrofolate dehydrogenase (NADP+)/methenyltetrahydrofolate cyclohydrolase